jgi:hypothetical protein
MRKKAKTVLRKIFKNRREMMKSRRLLPLEPPEDFTATLIKPLGMVHPPKNRAN